MRILIIEDDAEAARFIVKGLAESGHTADLATDGEAGSSGPWQKPMTFWLSIECCPSGTGCLSLRPCVKKAGMCRS
jgi:DNA-binding NtrC family response regulator